MSNKLYYAIPAKEVEQELNTSIKSGLSSAEAQRRIEVYGLNEFQKKKPKTLLVKFLEQFKSFMIIVLLIAAAVSGIVGYLEGEGFMDSIIILAIVLLNACIGVAQEAKAEKSLEALEKMTVPQCKVIRDGVTEVIPSQQLVPGDIVVIETGDSIPADLRLIEAVNLKIQDAAITGESLPKEGSTDAILTEDVQLGDRSNMGFSSSIVAYGRGKGIVTETGMNTEVGKIASMIQSVGDTKTPLQVKLDALGKYLGIAALIICVLIFCIGMLYGKGLLEMFMISVSLAAAAIPEGLPAVSTIVLAVGVQRLAKKRAIVRRLPSVETLGSTTVICSDKTGTLTQNRMTVVEIMTNDQKQVLTGKSDTLDKESEKLIKALVLANDAVGNIKDGKLTTSGDPTETALLDLGHTFGVEKNILEEQFERKGEVPFDSDRKMMTTVNKDQQGYTIYTKGGVEEVLTHCNRILLAGQELPLTEEHIRAIKTMNSDMAQRALRVLAAAYHPIEELPLKVSPEQIEKNLVFIGMVGMIDPPRVEVKDAVAKCRMAGIKPVMITGDHKITAVAIAESLGIKKPEDMALTGADIAKMSDEELRKNIGKISVYARVSPEHKVRIVKAFQQEGEIVAMTGDGVNDAPALKLADIGIAMGIVGTDVSKQAADVVLADDNFATIITAVEEGRRIYNNILKAIQFMLSTNIGEIVVLLVAVLANWSTPLLPIHILWINLVTDSLPALALSVDPAEKNIMHRKPLDARAGIMTRSFSTRLFLQGGMIGAISLAAFLLGLHTSGGDEVVARTMTFSVLAFTQLTHVFNVRSNYFSAFKNMFSNKYLLGAIFIVASLMLIVLEVPYLHDIFHVTTLTGMQWIWVIGLSISPLMIMEVVKGIMRMMKK